MVRRICDLKIELKPLSWLKPNPRNARKHREEHVCRVIGSFQTFGWTNPIIVDADGNIIAGHARYEAAKRLGLEEVPVICIKDMTKEQIRAYTLADNQLGLISEWDEQMLALELKDLSELGLDFDLEVIGFETAEIDLRIDALGNADSDDEADHVPEVDDSTPPVTRPGDLWLMGKHRLLCGDATTPEPYALLMGEERARMVFTDPPYNVPIDGHVCGLGAIKHEEFAMASGEMSEAKFTAFLLTVLQLLARHSVPGALHYICMDWRHLYELMSAGREAYSELKNLCIWNKTNGGMGSLYRSKHEMIAVFKSGRESHVNNVNLGSHGRYRTNVWDYPGVNSFGRDRHSNLAAHPTSKPVALVKDAILDCSRRGDIVLDPFSGSGTTIIAAQRAGRRAFVLELKPRYVDVALQRFRKLTGEEPIHAESGQPLSEVEASRNGAEEETNE